MSGKSVAARTVAIAVKGGEIEADIAGEDASGAPILFLHGWTLDRRMWALQVGPLSKHHPIIAIDRRGFGRSTAPPALELEIDDIVAVQDALSLGASAVVGMSQAGRVALEFALQRPERTSALILQGVQLEAFKPAEKESEAIPVGACRELVKAGRLEDMRRLWRAHPLMRTSSAEAEKTVREILDSYDGRDLLVAPAPGMGAGPDALGRIAAPTLVVTGDRETPWRRLVADAIAYGAPGARRIVIENAGHLCNLCRPDAYNAAILSFFNEAGI